MKKQIFKNRILVVIALLLAITVPFSSSAFAWGGGHRGGHWGDRGGRSHYVYRSGNWHSSGWFWGSLATGLAIGAIVASLPPRHQTVYVRGSSYYYCDGVYYRPCSSGYVVVQAPATTTVVAAPAVTQPNTTSGETIVINIPNANGGYTAVTLTKYKIGYIGPQGEYYGDHPTVEQLRVLYGK